MMTRNSWMMSGFQMKPISFWMVMSNLRTGCFGEVRTLKVVEHPLYSKMRKTRVTILKHRTIGTFSFEDDWSDSDNQALHSNIWTVLRNMRILMKRKWFQQDGANTANITIAWLCEKFGEHVISHKTEVGWALYLPDPQISSSKVTQGQNLSE